MSSLKKGEKGVGVMLLQGILHKLGYDITDVDGVFGSETLEAVRAFQADQELTNDGAVGKNTANALIHELWAIGGESEDEDGDWEESDDDWGDDDEESDDDDDWGDDEGGDDYDSV